MHGARKFACDYIVPRLRAGLRVLDVCCGDGWTSKLVLAAGSTWHGIDKGGMDSIPGCPRRIIGDVLRGESFLSVPECSGLILDVYGTQHLLDQQAKSWDILCGELTDDGRFISVGRYRDWPGRETDRQDPLNGHNRCTLEGLAMACGLRMTEWQTARYEGDEYWLNHEDPNAYAATFERW